MLEAAKEDLILNDGRVMVRGVQGKSVSYPWEAAGPRRTPCSAMGIFVSGSGPDGSPVVLAFGDGTRLRLGGSGISGRRPTCEGEARHRNRQSQTNLFARRPLRWQGHQSAATPGAGRRRHALRLGGKCYFEELSSDTNGGITNPNLSD